jgi:hypothetical protein
MIPSTFEQCGRTFRESLQRAATTENARMLHVTYKDCVLVRVTYKDCVLVRVTYEDCVFSKEMHRMSSRMQSLTAVVYLPPALPLQSSSYRPPGISLHHSFHNRVTRQAHSVFQSDFSRTSAFKF